VTSPGVRLRRFIRKRSVAIPATGRSGARIRQTQHYSGIVRR